MQQHAPTLNLARQWRPKTFDEVIGQDLSIKMLKNALYKKQLFPVYLFAGQRGCGKTSTARVFATAVNCEKLPEWQENPKNALPCLSCTSCNSMLASSHPDFIEMDAASHTGVDDVRQLTESASYMPLAGNKKVYLIDEAHMLSKAAFNAFLKILEEPPPSVLFILATTESHKIPETVRSRCFQVLFNPIAHDNVLGHLKQLCAKEEIAIDDDALGIIAYETDGSARDAINLLEKVRFSSENITQDDVLSVLGKMSEHKLYKLFGYLLDKNPKELLTFLAAQSAQNFSPATLWNMIIDLLRTLTWVKFGVVPEKAGFYRDTQTLQELAKKCSLNRLQAILQLFWSQEQLFMRTHHKRHFLEVVLLQVCQQVPLKDLHELLQQATKLEKSGPKSRPLPPSIQKKNLSNAAYSQAPTAAAQNAVTSLPEAPPVAPTPTSAQPSEEKKNPEWDKLISLIQERFQDPILTTLFRQMTITEHNREQNVLHVQLANQTPFFLEKLQEMQPQWEVVLHEVYPATKLVITKVAPVKKAVPAPRSTPSNTLTREDIKPPAPAPRQQNSYQGGYNRRSTSRRPAQKIEYLDISDTEKWPTANLIASTFSAKIEKRQS